MMKNDEMKNVSSNPDETCDLDDDVIFRKEVCLSSIHSVVVC